MPCSRTPKWMLRPLYSLVKKSPAPSKTRLVLLDLARSAEPPTSQGIFCARALGTLPELSRVAMPFGSAGKFGRFLSEPSGSARRCILPRRGAVEVGGVGDKAGHHVLAEGPACRAVEGDAIVVVDPAEIRKREVPGERGGFAPDAFHQVSIAADGIDAKVEKIEARLIEIRGQPFSGDGHADTVGDALAKRAGGGFNARGDVRFRVSGSAAAELAEALDLVHWNGKVLLHFAFCIYGADTCEMQRGIEKHGSMAGGENEAIAIGPERVGGLIGKKTLPQGKTHCRQSHASPRMARLRPLHRVT